MHAVVRLLSCSCSAACESDDLLASRDWILSRVTELYLSSLLVQFIHSFLTIFLTISIPTSSRLHVLPTITSEPTGKQFSELQAEAREEVNATSPRGRSRLQYCTS